MVKILVDTSFLLIVTSKPLKLFWQLTDILGKYDFLLLRDTIKELKTLSEFSSPKKSKLANRALELIAGYECVDYNIQGNVDDKILNYASENKVIVATLDRQLRIRLREKKLPVITLISDRVTFEGII